MCVVKRFGEWEEVWWYGKVTKKVAMLLTGGDEVRWGRGPKDLEKNCVPMRNVVAWAANSTPLTAALLPRHLWMLPAPPVTRPEEARASPPWMPSLPLGPMLPSASVGLAAASRIKVRPIQEPHISVSFAGSRYS